MASFINVYASQWWEGALMLAIYFALAFNANIALSGVGHDLEWSQRKLVHAVEGKNPNKKNPDEPGAAIGSNFDSTAPKTNVPQAVSADPTRLLMPKCARFVVGQALAGGNDNGSALPGTEEWETYAARYGITVAARSTTLAAQSVRSTLVYVLCASIHLA